MIGIIYELMLILSFIRPVPQELCGGKSSEEHVRVHAQPEAPRPLQFMLPGKQKFSCSDLGMPSAQSQKFNADIFLQPVRVAPEAYYLFDAAAVGVPELCDAFKVRLVTGLCLSLLHGQ